MPRPIIGLEVFRHALPVWSWYQVVSPGAGSPASRSVVDSGLGGRPDQRYSAAGLERNGCSCGDAEKFRILGKTLEVPEAKAFKTQP